MVQRAVRQQRQLRTTSLRPPANRVTNKTLSLLKATTVTVATTASATTASATTASATTATAVTAATTATVVVAATTAPTPTQGETRYYNKKDFEAVIANKA